jgi:hypothetical protein
MIQTAKRELYVPSKKKILHPRGTVEYADAYNVVQTSAITQANADAQQWFAGLMQGIWQGGNNWLTLEVGTGTNTSETVPSRLQAPLLRKLIDSIIFVQNDGVTSSLGPSTTLQLNASLQTPDGNGQTISEYGIYGGGLNLNQAPFATGLLILYQTITPIVKTSAFSIQFQVIIQV